MFRVLLPLLLLLGSVGLCVRAEALTPELALPLACEPNKTCWIANYVDVDPGPEIRDYNCGTTTYAEESAYYKGHQGTDFALRDEKAMRDGVTVLAAAPGVVIASRDGMPDVSVRRLGGRAALKGNDCGNRVGIDHGDGLLTDYCHLRKGSVLVRTGDKVHAGQPLGKVGMSGASEYPHLHFGVLVDKQVTDPFVGLEPANGCGPGPHPLWAAETLAKLSYRASSLYTAGFASEKPTPEKARDGGYRRSELSIRAPALVFWVDTFHPFAGDELTLEIVGPDGQVFFTNTKTMDKTQARRFDFGGLANKAGALSPGPYKGTARLVRAKGPRGREDYVIVAEVTLR